MENVANRHSDKAVNDTFNPLSPVKCLYGYILKEGYGIFQPKPNFLVF